MKSSNEENGQMPQEQGNEYESPPPYTFDNVPTVYNNNSNVPTALPVNPNWTQNISNVFNHTSLDLLNQTLGNNERFTLFSTGQLGCMNRTAIVQIRDPAQRPILSVMTISGRNIPTARNNDNTIRIGSVIQITNSAGQTLLNGNESGQVVAIEF